MLNAQQVRELAAAAICSLSTVTRVYEPNKAPHKPRHGTVLRIAKAARELGFPPPPQPEGGR